MGTGSQVSCSSAAARRDADADFGLCKTADPIAGRGKTIVSRRQGQLGVE